MVGGIAVLLLAGGSLAYTNFSRAFASASVEQSVNSNLWLARQLAITQRVTITVTFQNPGTITISGGQIVPTQTYTLPSGYTYDAPANAPAAPTGTTNLQGKSINFLPDGSAVDPGTGGPVNGMLYLTDLSGGYVSSGMITISGASAYIKSYSWDKGSNTWQ